MLLLPALRKSEISMFHFDFCSNSTKIMIFLRDACLTVSSGYQTAKLCIDARLSGDVTPKKSLLCYSIIF